MTIFRTIDGKKTPFELTSFELYDAYDEVQKKFDEEDVAMAIDYDTDDSIRERYGISLEEFKALIPAIARRMRRYLNNDDDWIYSRDAAIDYVVDDYLKDRDNDDKTVI